MRTSTQPKEFNAIFDSLAPTIARHLDCIDHTLRMIYTESSVCGVKREVIEKQMRARFWELFQEVANKSA